MGEVDYIKHRGCDFTSIIRWGIDKSTDGIFVYTLQESGKSDIKYVGITNSPSTRLSHHIKEKGLNHKNSWLRGVLNRGGVIVMSIVDKATSYEEATILEESYINKNLDTITNHILTPTIPHSKTCYVLNIYTNDLVKFVSRMAAYDYMGVYFTQCPKSLIKSTYVFSYYPDVFKIVEKRAKILLTKDNITLYALNQKHAGFLAGVTPGMINLCIMGQRKSANGYLVYKVGKVVKEYKNNHYKPVICKNDGKLFPTAKAAAVYYSVDPSMISKICKGKRKGVKGLIFKYSNF